MAISPPVFGFSHYPEQKHVDDYEQRKNHFRKKDFNCSTVVIGNVNETNGINRRLGFSKKENHIFKKDNYICLREHSTYFLNKMFLDMIKKHFKVYYLHKINRCISRSLFLILPFSLRKREKICIQTLSLRDKCSKTSSKLTLLIRFKLIKITHLE